MAVSSARIATAPNLSFGLADVTLDSSYVQGGYVLAPSVFGFTSAIVGCFALPKFGYTFMFNPAVGRLEVRRSIEASTAVSVKVAAGAAAAAPVTVSGIDTADVLVSVLHFPAAGGPPVDRTSEATVTAGHVTLATTSTTGDTLVVTYQEDAGLTDEVAALKDLSAVSVRCYAWGF